jgi:hypothetical protein
MTMEKVGIRPKEKEDRASLHGSRGLYLRPICALRRFFDPQE